MANDMLSRVRELASVAEELTETYKVRALQQAEIASLKAQMNGLAAELKKAEHKHSELNARAEALQVKSQV